MSQTDSSERTIHVPAQRIVNHPLRLHPGPASAQRAAAPAAVVGTLETGRSAVELEVAIPAFNEARRLPTTLQRTVEFLRQQPWSSRVVVVDNGSCDDTADVVRALADRTGSRVPVELVGCARPGKGAAVRRALLSSRSRFVGFFDADLATPVETLAAAMVHLRGGASAVIASRHAPGAQFAQPQPAGRRLGGAAFRLLARTLVKDVWDTQCGFKFFEREAVTHALVSCRTTGFAFDVELLRQLQWDGHRIVELPVTWTDARGSSFRCWHDGIASFGDVLSLPRFTAGWTS
ncbi:Glycosyl transferase family 2 [Geodermatophilus africanus]|uniref:Glycosyl transferase family 2 n=1 Tax=Geodermatophilus africanus TaxID=1137993 RepID=A0A1H3Q679_9ACTN|nr:glycosyltransferase [Geodermatophilus africanus]SDZ08535.1 Glycosyl transferase family 2 [Geodermatophilus africanus]